MSRNDNYDVIIIGAGIGGLVCGCYLAKAGFKTLLVEKNSKPGGYCTSFVKNGYFFDSCAHSIGSCRKNGHIERVINDLKLHDRISFRRDNPSDIIVFSGQEFPFWSDLNQTISNFQNKFPKESKNIERFFQYISSIEGLGLLSLKNKTLKDLLDEYLKNDELKAILSLPILGNGASAPSAISALTAVTLFKEFLLDGGYYPEKGMQQLADVLMERFKEFHGEVLLSHRVQRIRLKNNKAVGIVLKNTIFSSRYVVSACDAMQTFFELIGKQRIDKDKKNNLNKLEPSLSLFVLYLGFNNINFINLPETGCNTWFLPHSNIEKMYDSAIKRNENNLDWFMIRLITNNSLIGFTNSSFRDTSYWKVHKEKIMTSFIKKIDLIYPGITKKIMFSDAATPSTLHRYTLNHKGAAYGWERTPSQLLTSGISQRTFFDNLYLAGHWTTLGHGIAGVAYSGLCTANLILKKKGSN